MPHDQAYLEVEKKIEQAQLEVATEPQQQISKLLDF
jgi:hypothetical protein